jgi:hypothetical protein
LDIYDADNVWLDDDAFNPSSAGAYPGDPLQYPAAVPPMLDVNMASDKIDRFNYFANDIMLSPASSIVTDPVLDNSTSSPSPDTTAQLPSPLGSPPNTIKEEPEEPRRQLCLRGGTSGQRKAGKRISHSVVERRYRESLNANLERLRQVLPSATKRNPGVDGGSSPSSSDSDCPLPKMSKSGVLISAVDYIHKLEQERNKLADLNPKLVAEILRLRRRTELMHKRMVLMHSAMNGGVAP